MIHTSRTVTVGKMESVINEPIMLYRGDREVEIEFNIVGSKFMFSNGGNVIKSTNATNGQLVINTPTGENMFSEVTECNDGKVICVITKEMIDELAEVGFYSFQIRLFDESQVSRVTIPPVYQGIEIRNPIAAEDETDLVDIGLVDFSVVRKDNYENVVTFLPNGDYNKTLWEEHDVISKDRLNKVEDALYEINKGTEGLYPTFQNQYDEFSAKVNKDVKAYKEEIEDEVEQFERDMTQAFGEFKVDYKDDVHDRLDVVEGELERVDTQLAHNASKKITEKLMLNNQKTSNCVLHRGGFLGLENSLSSIQIGYEAGYRFFEIDIQKCKSGEWILMHDTTLDRTTNGTGKVIEKTLQELELFSIDAHYNSDCYINEKIPTLEEVLFIARGLNISLMIEVKNNFEDIKELIPIIEKYNMEDKCMVFIPASITAGDNLIDNLVNFRKANKTINVGLMKWWTGTNVIDMLKSVSDDVVWVTDIQIIDEANIKLVRDAGFKNIACYTVNTVDNFEKAKKLGVNLIITDCFVG